LTAAALSLALWPAPIRAQPAPVQDPLESMAFRFGPIGLSPAIAITDVGVDSNIFNESGTPHEDFTATITPQLVARLRAGRVLLTAGNATGFVYYLDFADERSINYKSNARADFDLGRLQPFVAADLQDTHERLNAELDVRAGRLSWSAVGGTKLIAGPHAALIVSGRRSDLTFDPGTSFDGVSLAETMNRRVESLDAAFEVALTPLTTLNLSSTWQQDRFDRSPDRDADSLMILPALHFDPIALVQGTLAIGYQRFTPRNARLPDYTGLLMRSSVSYTLLERTRAELRFTRDVQYSFEQSEPYYLSTGISLHVTHHLSGPFDLQATGGRERLDYRSIDNAVERLDRADTIAFGAGYRLAENARLGLTWEYTRRLSPMAERKYDRRRIFASLSYGI
jgi:Putative beta-barrel porin 2